MDDDEIAERNKYIETAKAIGDRLYQAVVREFGDCRLDYDERLALMCAFLNQAVHMTATFAQNDDTKTEAECILSCHKVLAHFYPGGPEFQVRPGGIEHN